MGKHLTGLCLAVSLVVPSLAGAMENGRYKTTVIEDRGGLTIKKYIPEIQSSKDWVNERYKERGNKKLMSGMFPVRTPSMKTGRVSPEEGAKIPKLAMAAHRMFIIGDDPVSHRWLAQNREFLKSKKAIGLVVNVENQQRMNALKEIAGKGLVLQPTPGEDMALVMGIRHYPFYVDQDGIMR